MNLEAALDYLVLEDNDADLAAIPPDIDNLTNEDTATPLVCDVLNIVEVVNADKEDGSDMPCTSTDPNPPAKKQQKERPKLLGKRKIQSTASGQMWMITSL